VNDTLSQALTILQFRGQTGPYLEPAGGPPSFDLRRVIRPELLVQILPAIGETSKTGVASRRDVRLETREISIEVIPLARSGGRQSFLILFDDGSRLPVDRSMPAAVPALTESEKDTRLAHLERELEGMREYMRAAIEEHEAIQEELRSAHEEIVVCQRGVSEHKRGTGDVEGGIQSTNEELTTTIDELRSRNEVPTREASSWCRPAIRSGHATDACCTTWRRSRTAIGRAWKNAAIVSAGSQGPG
jgi:two-component system CheB/CheR fusion protein